MPSTARILEGDLLDQSGGAENDSTPDSSHRRLFSAVLVIIGAILCLWAEAFAIWILFDPLSFPFDLTFSLFAVFLSWVAFSLLRSFYMPQNDVWRLSGLLLAFPSLYVAGLEAFIFPGIVNDRSLRLDGHWYLLGGLATALMFVFSFKAVNVLDRLLARLVGKKTEERPPVPKTSLAVMLRRYWKQDLLCLGILLVVLTAFGFSMIAISPPLPVNAKHLTHDQLPYPDWLPAEGSDFYYRRSVRGTFYWDFQISEQEFRRWIESKDWWEYCESIKEERPEDVWSCIEGGRIDIFDGLTAGRGERKGSRAVFDHKTNRAYYWTFY